MHLNMFCLLMEDGISSNSQGTLTICKYTQVGDGCSSDKLDNNLITKTHSTIALNAALYSASQLDVATVGCFLLSQETQELLIMKQLPLCETQVS